MPHDYDFWVYIVTNQNDSVIYIGMTNDLARRISEHRAGELPGFTAEYRCNKLIYYEYYSNVDEAIGRETQLKKWSRAKKTELIKWNESALA
jgi:putative endonuclease